MKSEARGRDREPSFILSSLICCSQVRNHSALSSLNFLNEEIQRRIVVDKTDGPDREEIPRSKRLSRIHHRSSSALTLPTTQTAFKGNS